MEFGAFEYMDVNLTPDNYRDRLHHLLFVEEYERRKRMSRYYGQYLFARSIRIVVPSPFGVYENLYSKWRFNLTLTEVQIRGLLATSITIQCHEV